MLARPRTGSAKPRTFILAENGKSNYEIVLSGSASEVEQFAAEELQKYLKTMTGAMIPIAQGSAGAKVILIGDKMAPRGLINATKLGFDGYVCQARPGKILLAGINDRGTLFSVYAFLRDLGCRWFAPNFDFYGSATGEVIPQVSVLRVPQLDQAVKPGMKYRKQDSGEAISQTVETLRQMIEWLPKAGMNVFMFPLNQHGEGKVVWDNYRAALIPELKKRGLLIEIGQHGYENFLPQKLYFDQHPDWFGMIKGKRSRARNVAFETANPQAMRQFLQNVKTYLKAHPEIDVFDLWPPDGVKWSESSESLKLGSPTERQALVVNAVAKMVKVDFPRMKVEFLAYQQYTIPPKKTQFEDNTILDFCPYARSFAAPLWDKQNSFNREYAQDLTRWLGRGVFKGDITIYTYYRKYSWRSLPIVIPRLIAAEAQHYQKLGVQGMSLYSEPADWFTFELNDYIMAQTMMHPDLDVAVTLHDYAQKRFGPASIPIEQYFQVIEETTRKVCCLNGSPVESEGEVQQGLGRLEEAKRLLDQAVREAGEHAAAKLLVSKLQASLTYAMADVRIRLQAWKMGRGGKFGDNAERLARLFYQLRDTFLDHQGEGVFLTLSAYTQNYVDKKSPKNADT